MFLDLVVFVPLETESLWYVKRPRGKDTFIRLKSEIRHRKRRSHKIKTPSYLKVPMYLRILRLRFRIHLSLTYQVKHTPQVEIRSPDTGSDHSLLKTTESRPRRLSLNEDVPSPTSLIRQNSYPPYLSCPCVFITDIGIPLKSQ